MKKKNKSMSLSVVLLGSMLFLVYVFARRATMELSFIETLVNLSCLLAACVAIARTLKAIIVEAIRETMDEGTLKPDDKLQKYGDVDA